MRRSDRRGAFLAQTTVLVVLLVFVATLILKLVLGRATIVHKSVDSEKKKLAAQAVQSKINSCLAEGTVPFGKAVCSSAIPMAVGQLTTYQQCFQSLPGMSYDVRVGGTPPACTFEIDIKDE